MARGMSISRAALGVLKEEQSIDGSASFLQIATDQRDAFWEAFRTGSRLAVRYVETGKCIDYSNPDYAKSWTLVYSLSGSSAALDFVVGGA